MLVERPEPFKTPLFVDRRLVKIPMHTQFNSSFLRPHRDVRLAGKSNTVRVACLGAMLAACFGGGSFPVGAYADIAAGPQVLVETVPARQGVITQPVSAYGLVAAGGTSVTTLSVPYAAQLVRWHVQRGQSFEQGAALFEVVADPAAVLAAQQAHGTLGVAQRELERTHSLYDEQLATRSQLDAANKVLADAYQADAAQQHLGARAGPVAIDAPFNGVVLQWQAAQGDRLQPGEAVMQLARSGISHGNAADLDLSVEPSDVPSIHIGDTVMVRALGADNLREAIPGRIVSVGAAIDSRTQQVAVAATLGGTATALFPGSHVVAQILPHGETHWIVPRSALLTDDDSAFVFQVDPQKKAHRVRVAIRVEQGANYGVDGPLNPGWPVVSSGNYELQDDSTVRLESEARR